MIRPRRGPPPRARLPRRPDREVIEGRAERCSPCPRLLRLTPTKKTQWVANSDIERAWRKGVGERRLKPSSAACWSRVVWIDRAADRIAESAWAGGKMVGRGSVGNSPGGDSPGVAARSVERATDGPDLEEASGDPGRQVPSFDRRLPMTGRSGGLWLVPAVRLSPFHHLEAEGFRDE